MLLPVARLLLVLLVAVLLKSCNRPSTVQQAQDDLPVGVVAIPENSKYKYYYVERGSFKTSNYNLVVKSLFILPDSLQQDSSFYYEGHFLFITRNSDGRSDSILVPEVTYYQDMISIEDVSRELQYTCPVFQLSWTGDSDQGYDSFISYQADSLQQLFSTVNMRELVRADSNTLRGFVIDRDELVFNFQSYAITISTKDYEVKQLWPDEQQIGWPTMALEDFAAHRALPMNKQNRLTIKSGTPLLIDSLNRKTQVVRIVVKDSIRYVPFSVIQGKVKGNDAG